MLINYDGRTFVTVSNTDHGEVSSETVFTYKQEGHILSAAYSGGEIVKGIMLGFVHEDGSLTFNYSHINRSNELRGGSCISKPIILRDGRIRLEEMWQWHDKDNSKGQSVVEEVRQ